MRWCCIKRKLLVCLFGGLAIHRAADDRVTNCEIKRRLSTAAQESRVEHIERGNDYKHEQISSDTRIFNLSKAYIIITLTAL
jgi:hypothetical protein